MASFDISQEIVSKLEGGYQKMYNDNGNWTGGKVGVGKLVGTKYGISAPTLKQYLKREIDENDMKNLSYETALKIYKKNYWDTIQGDLINNQSIANIIYQTAVHAGVSKAKKITEKALGKPYSANAINQYPNQKELFDKIKSQVADFYSKQGNFAQAFLKRLSKFTFFLTILLIT